MALMMDQLMQAEQMTTEWPRKTSKSSQPSSEIRTIIHRTRWCVHPFRVSQASLPL